MNPQDPIVFIVDDDHRICEALSTLLSTYDLRAVTFGSAAEYLAYPKPDAPACLILDVQMPGMTGVDLQDDLLKRGHHIPIIFITAFPEDRVRDRVLRAGAVSFLAKPFDGRKMIDCLRAALQKHTGGADK